MKNKTIIVIISILIACASLVLLLLGNGKLITQSYGLKDNKDIAVFIYDYKEEKYKNVGNIPTGNYTLQEESFCKNGSKIVSYDSSKGVVKYTMNVADKCYLYFKGLYTISEAVNDKVSDNEYTSSQDQSKYVVRHEYVEHEGTTYDAGVRYEGNDPDNYVQFNGNEEWRIIGVFEGSTIGLEPGKQYTKIMRASRINRNPWDLTCNYNEYGVAVGCKSENDWTNSTLNTFLNTTYLNGGFEQYVDYDGTIQKALTTKARNQIATYNGNYSTWYLRGTTDTQSSSLSKSDWYIVERVTGGIAYRNGVQGQADSSNQAAIGIINISDYLYGYYNGNWTDSMTTDGWLWTLNPNIENDQGLFITDGYYPEGLFLYTTTDDGTLGPDVVPTLYLESDIEVIGGTGSKEHPYELAIPERNLSETIINSVSNNEYTSSQDNTKYVVRHEQVTHEGTTYDAGVRYEGNDPDNYVQFNGNEEWRIIGVFEGSTIGLESGKWYTKIIKSSSIGQMEWDDNENDWTNSTLNAYLNGEYLESFTDENKIAKYNGNYSTWYLRGMNSGSHEKANTLDWYLAERTTGSPAPNVGASTTEAIGIMYPSDYGYAAYGSTCDNKTSMTLYNYGARDWNTMEISGCAEVDWLLLENNYEWLISPYPDDSVGAFVVNGYDGGYVYDDFSVHYESAIRPVLYLEASVEIDTGEGTKASPYILK